MGLALEALFSYIQTVMGEAFKATKTVMKGKVVPQASAAEKGGSWAGVFTEGKKDGCVKPTAPLSTISRH